MLFSSTQISQKSSRSSSGRWRCASYRQVEPISRSNPPEAPEDTIQHAAENLWPSAVCKCGLLKNSECTDSRGASRDNYTMHHVHIINKLETESFLCVKCCFISVWVKQKKRKKYGRLQAQFQVYAGDAALFATRWIFMPRIPPSREKPNIFAVFLFLWGVGKTMLIKTYLCLAEQQCIWYSLKKTMISAIRGAQAPDSSVLPCSLSCSVLIFFWDCLWDCVSKRRPIDFPFRGFCRSRGLSLTINIKHVIK